MMTMKNMKIMRNKVMINAIKMMMRMMDILMRNNHLFMNMLVQHEVM